MTQQVAAVAARLIPSQVARSLTGDPFMDLAHELPPLLTVAMVADACHVNQSTVWAWMARGELRSYKRGGRVLILRGDLIDSLRVFRPGPGEEIATADEDDE